MSHVEAYRTDVPSGIEQEHHTSLRKSPAILFIMMLTAQGCSDKTSPDETKKYELILSRECSPSNAGKISAKQLAAYDQQLPDYFCRRDLCKCVAVLVDRNIAPEEIAKYFTVKPPLNSGTTLDDLIQLIDAGITAEQATKYNSRLRGQAIAQLVKAGVTPEQAQEYLDIVDETDKDDREIGDHSFLALAHHKFPPEQIRKYTNRFKGIDIAKFIEGNILPEQALAYPGKLLGPTIRMLIEAGIDSERTKSYPEYFSNVDIYQLASKNITPETANKYPPYGASEIIRLIEEGVSPETAKQQYDKEQNEGQEF